MACFKKIREGVWFNTETKIVLCWGYANWHYAVYRVQNVEDMKTWKLLRLFKSLFDAKAFAEKQ